MAATERTNDDVAAFLRDHHGVAVTDVEPLRGGFWSDAFAYRTAGRELVVRFGADTEGFEMDRTAAAWSRSDLPIPEVLAVGTTDDGSFAISVRHRGRFLEDVPIAHSATVGDALERLLAAFRAVPTPDDVPSRWYPPGLDPSTSTWRRWLLDCLVDDPELPMTGWRALLAAHPRADEVFEACARRVRAMVDACPERRDLVHGDLLHQNVLVDDEWTRITAVFSWKCSVRGDFLFDVAWCTFWSPWHPGIAAIDIWRRTLSDPILHPLLEGAAERHHCYELAIGANHLGWHAWTGDQSELQRVTRHTEAILERGPLLI